MNHKAFSLVECMLSLVLTTLLLTSLISELAILQRQSHHTAQTIERAYDINTIFTMMSDSIRSAGYTPCASIDRLKYAGNTSIAGLHTHAIEIINPEYITVSRMHRPVAPVLHTIAPNIVIVSGHPALKAQDRVLLADCFTASWFIIQSVQKDTHITQLTMEQAVPPHFSTPAYLGLWRSESFFMRRNQHGAKRLYYKNLHTEMLSDWIDNMEVSIQQDLSGRSVHLLLHTGDKNTASTRVRVRT